MGRPDTVNSHDDGIPTHCKQLIVGHGGVSWTGDLQRSVGTYMQATYRHTAPSQNAYTCLARIAQCGNGH